MFRIAFYSAASAIAVSLAAPFANAADKIEKVVVTASRIGTTSEQRLGTAVSILTREQLEQRQTRFVSDVLRDVPGVAVSRSGGPGSSTQVRMRGAEGNHTLVLLDGADIGDPFQGEFDFSGLLAGDIERIEILRGSQSALYGSDAIGGVINIIARRGKGNLALEGFAEAGSFDAWQLGANAGYGDNQSDIFVSLNRHDTSGTNMSRFGSERDGERDGSLFFNAGLRPFENLELRALLRYVDTRAEGDPQDFDFLSPTQGLVIDGNDVTETEQLYGNVSAEWAAFADAWRTRLNYAFVDADRRNFSDGFPSFFSSGDRRKLSLVSAFTFDTGAAHHKLTGAVDWKREHYQNVAIGPFDPGINGERELDTTGWVASYDLSLGDFDAGAAFRHDRNDRFKDAETYRLQASYRLTGTTRLRATAGTGIKNPNNFELFGFDPSSFIGNPNLRPEQSTGWDVGVDQSFAGGAARVTATYFEAELKDEIYTDFSVFPFTAANHTGKSDRRGIELTLDAKLADDWTLDAAYTYLEASEAGLQEVRRPPHTGSLNLTYSFLDRATATLTVRYTGERQDNEFIFATPQDFVALPAFTLVNLNTSYDVNENLQLQARVENVFDESYEEVFTYRAPGIAAYVGLHARF